MGLFFRKQAQNRSRSFLCQILLLAQVAVYICGLAWGAKSCFKGVFQKTGLKRDLPW
jgi:hypothetical protein